MRTRSRNSSSRAANPITPGGAPCARSSSIPSANAPWEKCARRAVPLVAADLLSLSASEGRTPLHRAQHVAARRRAEQIAGHLDRAAVLTDLGLDVNPVDDDRWREAIGSAVGARSREQVARSVKRSLSEP